MKTLKKRYKLFIAWYKDHGDRSVLDMARLRGGGGTSSHTLLGKLVSFGGGNV